MRAITALRNAAKIVGRVYLDLYVASLLTVVFAAESLGTTIMNLIQKPSIQPATEIQGEEVSRDAA